MQLLHNHASSKSKALVEAIIENIPGLSKPRKAFIVSTIVLFLSIRGRYTFTGMSRYGEKSEKTYRLQFEKDFAFLDFNIELCRHSVSDHVIIAFDPSYLPKSGKHTPHRDKFYSGCLGKAVQGLEIGGLGLVDVDNNTAMSLEAIQTPDKVTLESKNQTLVDHYANIFIERRDALKALSDYAVTDGYFAKETFVNPVVEKTELHVISKFRQDARLQYLHIGLRKKGRGRPRKFDGKVKLDSLDEMHFHKCHDDDDVLIYQAVVWSVSLKRKVKLAYVRFKGKENVLTNRYALYFCTDLELDGYWIYRYYKARFQIEFLFRDAKQHTGLTHCQAKSEAKLRFHFNASLTAVSVAKAAHYLSVKPDARKAFSLADIKTSYFNELMLNLFLSNFHVDPDLVKNKFSIRKLLNYGIIAA
ncbi:MAG: transposase [Saprospiraceae bacterium]